jgi:hypothetical protein
MPVPLSRPDRQLFVQNAYHVADLDSAIVRWHEATGLGPFLVRRHIRLDSVRYRGAPSTLDISAAHVQSGSLQIELVQQHDGSPSAFRDMFAPDEEGLHHVALFPEDHQAMVDHYEALGFASATDLITAERRGATYVDARPLCGHMIEIYRVNDSLIAFYEQIAEAARNWDGRDLVMEV